jgi:hypothetical protein
LLFGGHGNANCLQSVTTFTVVFGRINAHAHKRKAQYCAPISAGLAGLAHNALGKSKELAMDNARDEAMRGIQSFQREHSIEAMREGGVACSETLNVSM